MFDFMLLPKIYIDLPFFSLPEESCQKQNYDLGEHKLSDNVIQSSGASSFHFLLPILPSICYTDGVFNVVSKAASKNTTENTHTKNKNDMPPVANS
jgi:hypothetical protein